MTTAKLSFEPQYHRYVEHGETSGWIVAVPPVGSVMSFATKISDEQRRIEEEGGMVLGADLKR